MHTIENAEPPKKKRIASGKGTSESVNNSSPSLMIYSPGSASASASKYSPAMGNFSNNVQGNTNDTLQGNILGMTIEEQAAYLFCLALYQKQKAVQISGGR